MALRTASHDLIDLSCVVGITASSKQQDGCVGNYFVLLDLEIAPKPIVESAAKVNADTAVIPESSNTVTEKIQVELTLPQFYHLLAELEECKSVLAASD